MKESIVRRRRRSTNNTRRLTNIGLFLPIHQIHVENIFCGKKRFEYRKCIFSREFDVVFLYVGNSVRRVDDDPRCRIVGDRIHGVVGQFGVAQIIYDTIDNLWERTKKHAGINRSCFERYFRDYDIGAAIEVDEFIEYKSPYSSERFERNQVRSFSYVFNYMQYMDE